MKKIASFPKPASNACTGKCQGCCNTKSFHPDTISVAVDMSPIAANALVFAWKIANRIGNNLEVVYAMDSIFEESAPNASGFLSSYTNTLRAELDTFIGDVLKPLKVEYIPTGQYTGAPDQMVETPSPGPSIRSKVIYGTPDIAITEYSRGADFLVMGATGDTGLLKRLFGSVSIQVSKNAHCPVLFVPMQTEFGDFENILYASDFNLFDELAVRQAVSFAERFEGQLHFVHVGIAGERNLEAKWEQLSKDYSEAEPHKPFIFSKMVSDDIVGSLYEYAFHHRTRLLVFVTRQRSFWDNILHKSITNEVLASSGLPILVVRSEDDLV
ncbi:MAG: universal stress protein [Phycisphaerae bacterium]|nr:universal stress protein [Saprospiraceae bacterium]